MSTTLRVSPKMSQAATEILPAIQGILGMGFIPTEDDIYELNADECAEVMESEPTAKPPIFTVTPKNPINPDDFDHPEYFNPNVVNIMDENGVDVLIQGIKFFKKYKADNGLLSATDKEVLQHVAQFMPQTISKKTFFEQPEEDVHATYQKFQKFFEYMGVGGETITIAQKDERGVTLEEHIVMGKEQPFLNYADFKAYIIEGLAKVFDRDKYEVKEQVSQRTDEDAHEAIHIWDKVGEMRRGNGFRVAPAYEAYCRGKPIGDVMLDIVQMIEESEDLVKSMSTDMYAFEKIKDKVILRAINYPINKKLLENHMYKREGDIAIVVYLLLKNVDGNMATAKIPKTSLEKWAMPDAEIFRLANENTLRLFKPILMQVEAVVRGVKPEKYPSINKFFMQPNFLLKKSQMGTYHIFADDSVNAATVPFLDGVMPRLADILQDDLYVVMLEYGFVAMHVKKKYSLQAVRRLVENDKNNKRIQSMVDKEEVLTTNVYEYRRRDGVFRMIPPEEV